MARPRKYQLEIAHVSIVLTNGTEYRISGNYEHVYELENTKDARINGPISLNSFIDLLTKEKDARAIIR